jgi:hypothetical protein
LVSYEEAGRVWVRRRAVPLTREESARLAEFALLQDGKRFAISCLGVIIPPFVIPAPAGPSHFLVRRQAAWSRTRELLLLELVMEAIAYVGLVDY